MTIPTECNQFPACLDHELLQPDPNPDPTNVRNRANRYLSINVHQTHERELHNKFPAQLSNQSTSPSTRQFSMRRWEIFFQQAFQGPNFVIGSRSHGTRCSQQVRRTDEVLRTGNSQGTCTYMYIPRTWYFCPESLPMSFSFSLSTCPLVSHQAIVLACGSDSSRPAFSSTDPTV